MRYFANLVLACAFTAFSTLAEGNSSKDSMNLVDAYNQFGFDLFAKLTQAQPSSNIFISPSSAAFALAAADSGAAGQTRKEIDAVLHVGGLADVDQQNQSLQQALAATNQPFALEIANGMWISKLASIKPGFVQHNQQFFGTEVNTVDFQNPSVPKAINDWVSGKTHGRIPEIIEPPIDIGLRLLLLNATYFKGEWSKPFKPQLTQPDAFTLLSGETIKHPRMSRSDEHFDYLETPAFQAVSLTYGKGAEPATARMVVFLPSKELGLKGFLPQFTGRNLHDWLAKFSSQNGRLGLPKFKLSSKYKLNDALKSMGMPSAFGSTADFSQMSNYPLCISDVDQKTFVDVNEQGTEAAAVTSIGMKAMAIRPSEHKPFSMIVDRPFCVAIVHQNGTLLFLGAIVDPR